MSIEKKNITPKKPFESIKVSGSLPCIPKLATNYMNKITNNIIQLDNEKAYLANSKTIENNNNNIYRKIYRKCPIVTPISKKKFKKQINENPYSLKRFDLKPKDQLKILTEQNSYSSGIFITNMSTNFDDPSFFKRKNSQTLNTSSSLGKNKKFLPPLFKKKEFINSLDSLMNNSNIQYEKLQNKIDIYNKYGELMIKKCNQYYNSIDNKMSVKSDEFLNEKIVEENFSTIKFNDYFDRLISDKKNFDAVSLMQIINNNHKKKIIRDLITKQKTEKNHKQYYKILENTQNDMKKTNELIDSFLNKTKEIKE